MNPTAVDALNTYIRNSVKTGDFSILDFTTPKKDRLTRPKRGVSRLKHGLVEPDVMGLESIRKDYTITMDQEDNPRPVRNIIQNKGYIPKYNTSNEYISEYATIHKEAHSKAKIGEDIIIT